ncbi:MAG TPA: hypothetical protein DCM07_06440, partial [Planctomycetaceae bacterium]|nr:hypothetical protein [Planctomycetaceae bacterium]
MKNRSEFCADLADLTLTHIDRAVAVLWYYRQSQEFEERAASDLAADLHEEGFPKPNVTRLREDLRKSRYVVKGKRTGTFQLDVRHLVALDEQYQDMLGLRRITVTGAVLPVESVAGTRAYLEQMVYQINGAYESGLYDASAVMCRRLMESLIIEVYISKKRQHEIQNNGVFVFLDSLVKYISNDKSLTLGRNTPKTMAEVKSVG